MREYAFELAVCAALEADSDGVLARQLGTHARVVDAVEVVPGPEFQDRVDLTAAAIPSLAIESEVGPGRARYWKDAVDAPSDRARRAVDRARRAVDRAVEIGFFEAERRGGREYVRQAARYPDWFDGLRAFENKPDLGRPGDLALQLRKDVSLGLFDEVILVTGSYVTRAHLNRFPEEVGVWRFDPEAGSFDVVREASPLAVDEPGIALLDEHPGRVDVEPVTAVEKARLRLRIAERAYGKGWRPETFPACERVEARGPDFRPDDTLPFCAWKGRLVDPARECGSDCAGHEPADPPDADVARQRERHTPWRRDPEGAIRRQAALDRFGDR